MIVHTYAVFLCNCPRPRLSNEDMNFVGAVLHGGGCDPGLLGEAHRRLPKRACMIVYVHVDGIMYHADVIAGLEWLWGVRFSPVLALEVLPPQIARCICTDCLSRDAEAFLQLQKCIARYYRIGEYACILLSIAACRCLCLWFLDVSENGLSQLLAA